MSAQSLDDFITAVRTKDLWLHLAWQDIKLRYRRSKIGPLWITLSMTIFCLALGVVYGKLFKIDTREYLPFLASGFVVWTFMAGLLNEFPNCYVDNAAYLKDIKINPFNLLLRLLTRHIIIFLHNIIIIIGIYIYFQFHPGIIGLLAVPGFILVSMNIFAAGVTLSIIGVRFRDIAPITQSLVQVLFFITPLMWLPRLVPADSWLMVVNPMVYYLDITRSPLLGEMPDANSWIASMMTLVFFVVVGAYFYNKKANRIAFWV